MPPQTGGYFIITEKEGKNMAYTKKDQIIRRIEHNYTDFKYSLRGVSREKLFELAPRIAAVTEAYEYLTEVHEWDDDNELEFYLLFIDPLTIVADAWESRRVDGILDVDAALMEIEYNDAIISEYPLVEGVNDNIIFIDDYDE